MPKLLKSSKTADLTSTMEVLNLRIFAPKIYWLVVRHLKHTIPWDSKWYHNLSDIMKEPRGGVQESSIFMESLDKKMKWWLQHFLGEDEEF